MNNYSDYVSPQKYTAAFIPGGLSDLTSWSDDDLEGFLEKAREDYPEGYVIDVLRGVNEPIKIPDSVKELKNNYRRYKKMQDDLGGSVFSYIAEMAFLFLMLFGMLKGTDKLVHRIFGI